MCHACSEPGLTVGQHVLLASRQLWGCVGGLGVLQGEEMPKRKGAHVARKTCPLT